MRRVPTVNVHIYPSVSPYASRILKQTASVIRSEIADNVIIVARHVPGLAQTEEIDSRRTLVRIPLSALRFNKNLFTETIAYFELVFRTLWHLRRYNVTLANAHSLSVLPTTVALRLLKGARVIYDAHELETERHGLRGLRRFVSKLLEKALMPLVDAVVVVSPSIAEWYRSHYPGKRVECVRNIPPRPLGPIAYDRQLLRSRINARDDDIVFIYQGLFGADRGIDSIVAAFAATSNRNVRCVFMGEGGLQSLIAEAANRRNNIHLLPPVPSSDVPSYSSGADIGLCLIRACCLSYYYCLPNKLFEQIAAGMPVIVTPCPDMKAIVSQYGNGWVLDGTAESLTQFLNGLGREDLERKSRAAYKASRLFGWQDEEQLYIKVLASLVVPIRGGSGQAT